MKKRIGSIMICMFLIISSLVIINPVEALNVGGNTLYVGGSGPGNYTRIQDAINNSFDGQTVYVYSGIYYESVDVNKRINLIGENRNNTIITYNIRHGHTIAILADRVTVRGFTISVNAINGNAPYCISIGSNYNTVSGNILTSNSSQYGIYIGGNNNIISDNIFTKLSIGIDILRGDYNTIRNNLFSNVGRYSIAMEDLCEYNMFKLNNFSYTAGNIIVGTVETDFYVPHPEHTTFTMNNFYIGNFIVKGNTNSFLNNYYSNWIGVKCLLFIFIPKRISVRYFIYDWQPSLKPYDIPIPDVP